MLRGAGNFSDNHKCDEAAYRTFLRSPHAHAEITYIDVSKAKKVAGCFGVWTAGDLKKSKINPFVADLVRAKQYSNRDGTHISAPPFYPLAD